MKIKSIPFGNISRCLRHKKLGELFKYIHNMKINTAIEVTLDDGILNLSRVVTQAFRQERIGYKISVFRQDFIGLVWKISKRESKKETVS